MKRLFIEIIILSISVSLIGDNKRPLTGREKLLIAQCRFKVGAEQGGLYAYDIAQNKILNRLKVQLRYDLDGLKNCNPEKLNKKTLLVFLDKYMPLSALGEPKLFQRVNDVISKISNDKEISAVISYAIGKSYIIQGDRFYEKLEIAISRDKTFPPLLAKGIMDYLKESGPYGKSAKPIPPDLLKSLKAYFLKKNYYPYKETLQNAQTFNDIFPDYNVAEKLLADALQQLPDNSVYTAPVAETLADCMLKKGNVDDAVKIYEDGLKKAGNRANANTLKESLHTLYLITGQKEKASKLLQATPPLL